MSDDTKVSIIKWTMVVLTLIFSVFAAWFFYKLAYEWLPQEVAMVVGFLVLAISVVGWLVTSWREKARR